VGAKVSSFDRERWRAVSPYFERALEMEPGELAAWLAVLRAESPGIAGDVEALLADRDAAGRDRFLESPEPWIGAASASLESVGPYRLIRRLGEGGMGIVFLAEQTGPIRREVALKLIKPGLDSEKVLARFSVERQILANLNHAGVSKVYDANVTADGRPWVAMEYVAGTSLNAFCDERRLPVRERLMVMLQVCSAIQHAHQKGVIHRDIKPSNVLVSEVDGKPLAKVIDFGIAKALEPQPGDALLTQTGTALGTPEYMSPEQLLRGLGEVDTRSDVYALGVVLYELLAGARPFASRDVATIRDTEPPRLSARIHSQAMPAAELASLRGTDSRRLARQLEGELDWIVMKALETQPARRYASAAELGADIERYLHGEPVLAGPPSTLYRIKKLARRHRIAVGALSVVLVTIVAGAVISSFALLRAKRAEAAARDELRASLISQAVTLTGSNELDRRPRSLAALAQAAAIRPGLDVRNAAIASLVTPGVHIVRTFSPYAAGTRFAWPDATLRRYARAEADGTITIHAIDTDALLMKLPAVRVPADVGIFSPDGRWLAVDYHDGQLRLWDLRSRTERLLVDGVGAYRFTPDSRRLVARSERRGHLIDLATGRESSWPESGRFDDATPATHPALPIFVTTSIGSREIVVRDSRNGLPLRRVAVPALGLATSWSGDGTSLITTHDDFSVRAWGWPDLTTPRLILRFHGAEPTHIAVDPTGRWLATSGWDNQIGIFDLRDGRLVLGGRGTVVEAARDRPAFVMENGRDWTVVAMEPPFAQDAIAWPESDKGPREVAWSPDGRWLAGSGPSGISVLDRASGKVETLLHDEWGLRIAFRPDSSELHAITRTRLHAWRVPAFEPIERNDAWPNGRLTGGISDDAERWVTLAVDARTRTASWVLGRFDAAPSGGSVAANAEGSGPELSDDGRWLAWGNWHGTAASAVHVGAADPRTIFQAGENARVTFAPGSKTLVVGGPSSVTFYDVGTWRPAASMARKPVSPLTPSFAFTHDAKLCAAVLPPDRLVLVDVATAGELGSMPTSQSVLAGLAFSPDDRLLAVASEDHHVLIWDIDKLRAELRRLGLDWR
jgi:serine/threonine protein kinase/WD40 repeat protein